MDGHLDQELSEIISQGAATGVLFADRNGLCICVKGDADPLASGFLTTTARRFGSDVICINSGDRDIMITQRNGMTMAVYKKPSTHL